jgi:hypothetical protein
MPLLAALAFSRDLRVVGCLISVQFRSGPDWVFVCEAGSLICVDTSSGATVLSPPQVMTPCLDLWLSGGTMSVPPRNFQKGTRLSPPLSSLFSVVDVGRYITASPEALRSGVSGRSFASFSLNLYSWAAVRSAFKNSRHHQAYAASARGLFVCMATLAHRQ